MSLHRITHALAAATVTAAVALTAWSAQAGATADARVGVGHRHSGVSYQPVVAPAPHKYGANGMRMGLHCETKDMS